MGTVEQNLRAQSREPHGDSGFVYLSDLVGSKEAHLCDPRLLAGLDLKKIAAYFLHPVGIQGHDCSRLLPSLQIASGGHASIRLITVRDGCRGKPHTSNAVRVRNQRFDSGILEPPGDIDYSRRATPQSSWGI
jgi:hypothetical protein